MPGARFLDKYPLLFCWYGLHDFLDEGSLSAFLQQLFGRFLWLLAWVSYRGNLGSLEVQVRLSTVLVIVQLNVLTFVLDWGWDF